MKENRRNNAHTLVPMDTRSTRPRNVWDSLIYLSVSFLKVCNCWKYSAVRKYLIIAVVCFVCLFFTVHVSRRSSRQGRRPDLWTGNSVYSQSKNDQDPADGEVNESVSPTRSNVVYITLKSKRHKPAIIRGTVRPKLRRKKVKVIQQGGTQGKAKDARHNTSTVNKRLGYSELDGSDTGSSTIRIYSEKAPPWFSNDDITAMRFLADSKFTQIDEVSPRGFSSLILFKSATNCTDDVDECRKCCGIVKRPLDMSEVFAFHLDRILGLNRTLPAVSRRFHSLGGSVHCIIFFIFTKVLNKTKLTRVHITRTLYFRLSTSKKCMFTSMLLPNSLQKC